MTDLTDPKLAHLVARYRAWVEAENGLAKKEREVRVAYEKNRHQDYQRRWKEYEEARDSEKTAATREQIKRLYAALDQCRERQRSLKEPSWWRIFTRRRDTEILKMQIEALQQKDDRLTKEWLELQYSLPDTPLKYSPYDRPNQHAYLEATYQGFLDWCVREGIEAK